MSKPLSVRMRCCGARQRVATWSISAGHVRMRVLASGKPGEIRIRDSRSPGAQHRGVERRENGRFLCRPSRVKLPRTARFLCAHRFQGSLKRNLFALNIYPREYIMTLLASPLRSEGSRGASAIAGGRRVNDGEAARDVASLIERAEIIKL